jgi:hypothetical protein
MSVKRTAASDSGDEHSDREGEHDELEDEADGVLEATLETGVPDGGPYGEREQAADHQEHAESTRDEAAHDSSTAQEQEGNREHDPEELWRPHSIQRTVSASA